MRERYGKNLKKLVWIRTIYLDTICRSLCALRFLLKFNYVLLQRRYFLGYLNNKAHPKFELMKKAACNRLLMSWRTEENSIDCGVFLMRHMETYMGYTTPKNWKCGLKDEGPEQQTQIYELRKKYLSKIIRSNINIKRSIVLDELEEYRRLPSDAKENLKNNRFLRIQDRLKNFS